MPVLSSRRCVALSTWVVAMMLTVGPARAQDEAPTDVAAEAEKKFDEGRELMMTPGQLDRACETLAESLALMERGDTYLNLAECHRRQGKTATAWREFNKALEHAKTVKFKEAIETAKAIRDGLEARLSTLTVTVPKATADLPGLSIALNGEPLPQAQWGTAMVLDPQSYVVTATADGHNDFSTTVELGEDKDVKEATITLTPVAKPPPPPRRPPLPPPPPPPVVSSGGGIHPVAIIGFAVAGVGFVAYGVTGGMSIDRRAQFDDDCPDDLCPAGSEDDIDEAILLADIATAALITGVVGAGVGVLGLFLDTGSEEVSLSVGPGTLTIRATF